MLELRIETAIAESSKTLLTYLRMEGALGLFIDRDSVKDP
jgi:hypothetical protein